MAIHGKQYELVREALQHERPYKGGSAMRILKFSVGMGRLEYTAAPNMDKVRDELRKARTVVYSYATPIAWVTDDGMARVPPVWYSVTTTNHQNLCRSWLGLLTDADRSELDA